MSRFLEWVEKTIEPVREFIIEHHNNPVFWIVMFFGAIVIAKFVYGELSRR